MFDLIAVEPAAHKSVLPLSRTGTREQRPAIVASTIDAARTALSPGQRWWPI